MERLVFALAFVGIAFACSPVPQPEVTGKGSETAKVAIVINDAYNPSEIENYMNHFQQTDIEQYSAYLGDFDFNSLTLANVDGYFAYVFILHNCVCYKVQAWMNQIADSSSSYKNAYAICPYPPTTTTTTTSTTTTTTTTTKLAKATAPSTESSSSTTTTTTTTTPLKNDCGNETTGTNRGNDAAFVVVVSTLTWNTTENNIYQDLYKTILTPQFGQIGCAVSSDPVNKSGYLALDYIVSNTNCTLLKSLAQQIEAERSEFKNVNVTMCMNT